MRSAKACTPTSIELKKAAPLPVTNTNSIPHHCLVTNGK